MNELIDIAVIDDQPLFRQGVWQALDQSHRCNLVAQGSHHDDAISIARDFKPHVMLIDVDLPGGGIKALERISCSDQGVRTIMLTTTQSETDLASSFKAGARGYLVKGGIEADNLIEIVRTVHRGDTYMDPKFAGQILSKSYTGQLPQQDPMASLTPRENDILLLVAKGMTNKEVALHYRIAEKTVKGYMTNILHKLSARNRVEAALIARDRLLSIQAATHTYQ